MTDLTEDRLKQLEEYADSFRNGSVSEKMLAERLREMVREVRRMRVGK